METSPAPEPLPVVRIARVPKTRLQVRWLVRDLWAETAVGVIGGTPKSGKTWLSLDLAVSVASGKPCLGRYAIPQPGPVLIYAAEDTPANLRERVAGIARARGVRDLDRLPVGLITEPGLQLDDRGHRRRLFVTLSKLKPRLLILDPLVRLHRSDENSSAEVSGLLGYLRSLQREFGVAIALVHHVRKSAAGQPGQALRGSGDLHAWGDSNLYLLRRKGEMELHMEHRAHASPSAVRVRLQQNPARLEVEDMAEEVEENGLESGVLRALASGRPMTRKTLRETLRVRNERLGDALLALEARGAVCRTEAGWVVPHSRP